MDIFASRFDAVNAELHLALPFSKQALCFTSWERGSCPFVATADGWRYDPDAADIPLIHDEARRSAAGNAFRRYAHTIPVEVTNVLARYEVDQQAMLQTCAATARGTQLLQQFPNLLWLLAPHLVQRSHGVRRHTHGLLGLKRKQLLEEALRLPKHATFLLRLLTMLPPPRLSDNARYWLTRIAACPRLSAFVRAHDIAHWWQLAIIARFFTEIQVAAMRRVVFEAEGYEAAVQKILQCNPLLRDTLRLGVLLRIGNAHTYARKCDNMQALQRLHDRWVYRAVLLRVDSDSAPFPPPPVQGTKDIFPLRTVADLVTEGALMHHCVASYASEIYTGNTYIYRMMFPERATLEVRKNNVGIWKLHQIKGPCNVNITRDSIKIAEHWVCSHLSESVVIGL